MGIEILLWVLVAGSAAVPVNNLFTLGKNITSVLTILFRKENKTPAEDRFSDIAPLASLVQRNVYMKALKISLGVLLVVGGVIYLTGRFSPISLGINEWIDIVIAIGAAFFLGTIDKVDRLKRLIATESEAAILREFSNCYYGYIREKREGLKILSAFEMCIVHSLPNKKQNAIAIQDIEKIIIKQYPLKEREEPLQKALTWLMKLGYVKCTFFNKEYYRDAQEYKRLQIQGGVSFIENGQANINNAKN